MIHTLPRIRALLCTLLLAAVLPVQAADVAGAKDHPLIQRVTGSEIFFSKAADFDQLKLALGRLEWSGAEAKLKPFPNVTAEGRRLTNYYRLPQGIGVLEALRNYEQDLRDKGFEILFSGRGEEVETVGYNNQIARELLGMTGNYATTEEKAQWPFQHTDEARAGYLSARLKKDDGEVLASIYVVANTHDKWLDIPLDRSLVRLDVVEIKAREQRMELVRSDEMANEISLNGRIALYGIEFDFNSASLRRESDATLTEIASLLKARPELNLLVVGHTDTAGNFEYNRSLSQKRAEAVVADLTAKGVAARRLFPVGVSFASPVATNATEEGRARNRRVELVDMAGGTAK